MQGKQSSVIIVAEDQKEQETIQGFRSCIYPLLGNHPKQEKAAKLSQRTGEPYVRKLAEAVN